MRTVRIGKAAFEGSRLSLEAFILASCYPHMGPWNTTHVASNPGPSGTPGSTVLNQTPPPAAQSLRDNHRGRALTAPLSATCRMLLYFASLSFAA